MRIPVLCLALAVVLLCPPTSAQWVQTNGPYGNVQLVEHLAVTSKGLFASVYQDNRYAVYRSTDDGARWRVVNTLDKFNVIIEVGPTLLAGTQHGVYVSMDDGMNWAPANNDGLQWNPVHDLVVNGSTLFAGVAKWLGGGVYVSTDNGWTWSQSGLTGIAVRGIVAVGPNLFAGTGGGRFAGQGIFLSTDNGTSWTAVNNGLTNLSILQFAVLGSNLYAVSDNSLESGPGAVFLSIDNGASWRVVSNGLTDVVVNRLAVSGTNLFAGTGGGVFLSTDNGTSWTAANTGIPDSLGVLSLAVRGPEVFAGTSLGLYLSTDNAVSWTAVNNGLFRCSVGCLAVIGTSIFAPTWSDGVFLTTNNGESWKAVNDGLPRSVVGLVTSGTNLYAQTRDYGVFLSTDSGASWTAVNYGLPSLYVFRLYVRGSNIYAVMGDGWDRLYMSTNNGTSWANATNGSLRSPRVVGCLAFSGGDMFAGTDIGVFRSTDNGGSWTLVNGGPSAIVVDLAVAGSNLFALADGGGMFVSTNDGASWNGAQMPFGDFWGGMVESGSSIFVGSGSGVFASTDRGMNWIDVNSGMTDRTVWSIALTGTNLFAGTNGGVWRRPLSEMITSVDTRISELPREFMLQQNYPNPFNPSTTIRLQLPQASMVRLSVYDMLGREVSVLVDGRMDAGVHEVKFEAAGFSSGVYLYRLQAGEFVQGKKFVFLK